MNCKGYESLVAAVKKDIAGKENCFNPAGCNLAGKRGRCSHDYCTKFAWVIARVNHYAEKTGVAPELILDSWESNRTYWYMNHYQDCNQPEIGANNVRVVENGLELRQSIGGRGFRCPACGGASTNPFECDSGIEINGLVCNWKAYGLFGTLSGGVYVFFKDSGQIKHIFMPVAWEGVPL